MTEVAIVMLLFGLGVCALGFWASRKLRAKDAENNASRSEADQIRSSTPHGIGRNV
jgi:hypothetical protein